MRLGATPSIFVTIVDSDRAERIAANILAVRQRLGRAARESGRKPDDITLVAVSKTFPPEAITAAIDAGIREIGENRVQEAVGKIDLLGKVARWHLIGHLQSNKAALAVRYFDMIQTLDSVALARKVSQQAAGLGRTVECLIEVNSSGEATKFGLDPAEVRAAAGQIAGLPGISLRGLMTIGPWTDDSGRIRQAFEETAALFASVRDDLGEQITVLSMGMSGDFETAIRCGATMVRIGSAIFDDRQIT